MGTSLKIAIKCITSYLITGTAREYNSLSTTMGIVESRTHWGTLFVHPRETIFSLEVSRKKYIIYYHYREFVLHFGGFYYYMYIKSGTVLN